MKRFSLRTIGFIVSCILCFAWNAGHAYGIEMEVLKYPNRVSMFSDFYVRVKIINNDKIPLRGCEGTQERCIAVGWDFVNAASAISPSVINLSSKSIVPVHLYGGYLLPGQAMEKSIRIPTGALVGRDVVLHLYLIVKEASRLSLKEFPLRLAVEDPPSNIKRRRTVIRTLVYGYLGLSLIVLCLSLFMRKGQSH